MSAAGKKASDAINAGEPTPKPWWTVPPPGQDARTSFGEIWRRYSAEVRRGESRVDVGAGAPIYSLICRLPVEVARAAAAALARHEAEWAPHHLYAPAAMHTTLLLLTPYLGIERSTDPAVREERLSRASAVVGDVLSSVAPFGLDAHGLNLFSSTVFVQLPQRVPSAPATLRRGLADGLQREFPQASVAQYEAYLPWDLLFANVVRFRTVASPTLVAAVATERETAFGDLELRTVDLVRTDRLLSPEATEIVASFELGG